MGTKSVFASLLDGLLDRQDDSEEAAEPYEVEDFGSTPTIPFDYLSVADELHSGRIHVEPAQPVRERCDFGALYRAELEAYIDAAAPLIAPAAATPSHPEAPPPAGAELPSVEPAAILLELRLEGAALEDFARIRRAFAFANHPDRVAPHLRERASLRMQIANMLIDDARRRARLARG